MAKVCTDVNSQIWTNHLVTLVPTYLTIDDWLIDLTNNDRRTNSLVKRLHKNLFWHCFCFVAAVKAVTAFINLLPFRHALESKGLKAFEIMHCNYAGDYWLQLFFNFWPFHKQISAKHNYSKIMHYDWLIR